MVGKESDGDFIFQCVEDRPYKSMVEILDGLEFEGNGTIVTSLVAGFDMEIDEVSAVTESIDGSLCLAFEIGVVEARGTWHINDLQAGITANASDEINGSDETISSFFFQRSSSFPLA